MDRDDWLREEQNRESYLREERQRENAAHEIRLDEDREDELRRRRQDIEEGTRKLLDGDTVAGLSELVGPDAALHYLRRLALPDRVDAIMDRIRQVVAEELNVDAARVTDAADLVDDLGADSLDCVEIVMGLEEAFAIEIADEEAEIIRTVADLGLLVRAKVEALLRTEADGP